MTYISFGSLSIAENLFNFVNDALLAELDIQSDRFWTDFEAAVNDLAPKNRHLLQKREELQSKLDKWLEEHKSTGIESEQYTEYLREIGYLMPEGENFQIETSNVDSDSEVNNRIVNNKFNFSSSNSEGLKNIGNTASEYFDRMRQRDKFTN